MKKGERLCPHKATLHNVRRHDAGAPWALYASSRCRRRLWRSRTSSARSPSRRPVTPVCSRNSSAASRCCIRTGSFKRARRSKRSCNRTPTAPWPTGASRSICSAIRCPPAAAEKSPDGLGSAREAQAIGAKTPRERDWIEALSAYYRDHDKVPVETRLLAYTKAMEQVTQRYPDDFEAWVFYALTLEASAPKADKTYANQLKSAAILEKLLQQQPEHPGVAHFLIHAYDFPPLAEKGLPAARRYTGLAPAASHARHMPSHIYSMVGLWEESIASNRFALEIQPDYYHASDFMVYAHLLGQDAKAKAMIEQAAGTADTGTRVVTFVNFTAHAAMPARYALERADWSGAAALPITATQYPMADSLTRFARGLGMARSGDLAGAKQEIQALQELRTALEQVNQSYWADRTEEQRLAVSAWVAHAEGRKASGTAHACRCRRRRR